MARQDEPKVRTNAVDDFMVEYEKSHRLYGEKDDFRPSSVAPTPGDLGDAAHDLLQKYQQSSETSEILGDATRDAEAKEIHLQFMNIIMRDGYVSEKTLANLNLRLRLKYQMAHPIMEGINAIKPMIKYVRSAGEKSAHPVLLSPYVQTSLASRWIHARVKKRQEGAKLNFEDVLFLEFCDIFKGTSELYAKRFQLHKPPH